MAEMTALGADWWNDSGWPDELAEAVALGATGGTSNPVIVAQTIKARPEKFNPIIDELATAAPADTEDEIAWRLIHLLAVRCAEKLKPEYDRSNGMKGLLSIQVSPKLYRDAARMTAQAKQLAALAPNIAIKMPATAEGISAMEEVVATGISINATVSFTVAQALAVAAALERGYRRRERAHPGDRPFPNYITLMVGRVDDHLKRVAEEQKIATTSGVLDWAGIAVFKNAYRLIRERGYRGTLLAAAYRHNGHWSEIIGRDVLQTIPYAWWTKFNQLPLAPSLTLDTPVDPAILGELRTKFPDFIRAYDEEALKPEEFVHFGATRHTLDQFLSGYADLLVQVRGRMLR